MKKIFNFKTRQGFSVAEIVIAIFVIVIGMLAILKLVVNNINYSILSRDQVIASQLAQEGFELIRNVRDNNIVNKESWDTDLSDISNACIDCLSDTQNPNFSCSTNQLYYDDSYRYVHKNSSKPTQFYRQIVLNEIDDNNDNKYDKVKVSIYVWWKRFSKPTNCTIANNCVYVQDYLTEH